jgi:hypothetical protein
MLPLAGDPPALEPFRLPQRQQRLTLDETVVVRVRSVKVEGLGEADGGVENDAGHARAVPARRVEGKRVEEVAVADLAGDVHELLTPGTEVDEEVHVVGLTRVFGCHAGSDAFRVIILHDASVSTTGSIKNKETDQVLGDMRNAVGCAHRRPLTLLHVG